MHESQILDLVDSVTMDALSLDEKAIIVADVKSELIGTRLAGNVSALVLQKVNDLSKGLYKESQALPKTFQDFSEHSDNSKPFAITNQDEIDEFLEKMISDEADNTPEAFFGDTWGKNHPVANMNIPGVPRFRSDFIAQY